MSLFYCIDLIDTKLSILTNPRQHSEFSEVDRNFLEELRKNLQERVDTDDYEQLSKELDKIRKYSRQKKSSCLDLKATDIRHIKEQKRLAQVWANESTAYPKDESYLKFQRHP